jgi:hypothetical protein
MTIDASTWPRPGEYDHSGEEGRSLRWLLGWRLLNQADSRDTWQTHAQYGLGRQYVDDEVMSVVLRCFDLAAWLLSVIVVAWGILVVLRIHGIHPPFRIGGTPRLT